MKTFISFLFLVLMFASSSFASGRTESADKYAAQLTQQIAKLGVKSSRALEGGLLYPVWSIDCRFSEAQVLTGDAMCVLTEKPGREAVEYRLEGSQKRAIAAGLIRTLVAMGVTVRYDKYWNAYKIGLLDVNAIHLAGGGYYVHFRDIQK